MATPLLVAQWPMRGLQLLGPGGHGSLTGFDDIPTASDVSRALTTVRVPMAYMGAEAVRLTLKPRCGRPRRRRLRSAVIERASTGRPG